MNQEQDIDKTIAKFRNNDQKLIQETKNVIKTREEFGLEGLVGGLDSIIINTEANKFVPAIQELKKFTGFQYQYQFETSEKTTAVLSTSNSPRIMFTTRKEKQNPFLKFNQTPKAKHLPNTRLETFVFRTNDLNKYVEIQQERGYEFLTPEIQDYDNYSFIQTKPSQYMGLSYGFIQWHNGQSDYHPDEYTEITDDIDLDHHTFQKNIKYLDHTASRVRARERDKGILEFLEYTNYHFDFAIYVKHLNSITSVARLSDKDFAMVFTSGISPFEDLTTSGPTEKFIQNYGTRTHHMAFHTENIEDTFASLGDNGMNFLIELVGNEDDGLKQTFTVQSPHTMLVNEYIHRYGDFDGFFTRSNVTDLTRATDKQ